MPGADGKPIHVRFVRNLHAFRGKLSSDGNGQPVHAGSDLRKREMVLDAALRNDSGELRRILVHELFHFAWQRLGNRQRAAYGALIEKEWERRARGELGWSAELRKRELRARPDSESIIAAEPKRWREYLCESFCDTGAWLYSGNRRHDEFTLAARFRAARAGWFRECFRERALFV